MRTICLALLLLPLLQWSLLAGDLGDWKVVNSADGKPAALGKPVRIGEHVYALGPSAKGNIPVWHLEAGTPQAVTTPEGAQLSLRTIKEIGGAALGAELASPGQYRIWQLSGNQAAAVLDDAGKQLVLSGPPKTTVEDQPGCPYFEAGETETGIAPPPGAKKMSVYWLSAGKVKRVDGPDLSSPKFAWTGRHMLVTNRGLTWLFTDGEKKELLGDDGKSTMLYVIGRGDYLLEVGGVHMFRIEGDRAKPLNLPEGQTPYHVFTLGEETLVWATSVDGGTSILRLDGSEVKETAYTKGLKKSLAPRDAGEGGPRVCGDVALFTALNPDSNLYELTVLRAGKAATVKLPEGTSRVADARPLASGAHVLFFDQGSGVTVCVLDAKNKLKTLSYPKTPEYLRSNDFAVAIDGLYSPRAQDGGTVLIYLAKP